MPFVNQKCPNCGKKISKDAEFCNGCGCPTAEAWSTCTACAASVGADSKFCWKCGAEQNVEDRKAFYGERWIRSPQEFARRVELAVPEKVFHSGVQVDQGTLALFFQDGRFLGKLEAGYHSLKDFSKRFKGVKKTAQAHIVLLDIHTAEVEIDLESLRTKEEFPVHVRIRLLFKVNNPDLFLDRFMSGRVRSSFSTSDFCDEFSSHLKEAVQEELGHRGIDEVSNELTAREAMESGVETQLAPVLGSAGLEVEGVRLASFDGPAIRSIREKLGELNQLNREAEYDRELNDALREKKLQAYRDELEMEELQKSLLVKYELKAVGRNDELEKMKSALEHRDALENLKKDYEVRRAEILNRIQEQKIRHQFELAEMRHELETRRLRFEEDLKEQKQRFAVGQDQQKSQAKTDAEVAMEGIKALDAVNKSKQEKRRNEQNLELEVENARLAMAEGASLQSLLANVDPERADRLLRLLELQSKQD